MNRLLENIILTLRYPRLAVFRLRRKLPLRVQVEIHKLKDEGLFEGITHFVDAGAHHGLYAESVMHIVPTVQIWCFEPAPAAYAALAVRFAGNRRVRCVEQALGASNGSVVLHVSGIDQANSVKKITEVHTAAWKESERVGEHEVRMGRLEDHLRDLPATARVFLKIDVQGAEKDVLLGCTAQLAKIQVVFVELSLVPLYEGSALLPEMVTLLDQMGFDLFAVVERIGAPGHWHPVQLDCVFVRKPRGSGLSH
jgi:FkbM family methyltransferase